MPRFFGDLEETYRTLGAEIDRASDFSQLVEPVLDLLAHLTTKPHLASCICADLAAFFQYASDRLQEKHPMPDEQIKTLARAIISRAIEASYGGLRELYNGVDRLDVSIREGLLATRLQLLEARLYTRGERTGRVTGRSTSGSSNSSRYRNFPY